jgi:hypothetical protein
MYFKNRKALDRESYMNRNNNNVITHSKHDQLGSGWVGVSEQSTKHPNEVIKTKNKIKALTTSSATRQIELKMWVWW